MKHWIPAVVLLALGVTACGGGGDDDDDSVETDAYVWVAAEVDDALSLVGVTTHRQEDSVAVGNGPYVVEAETSTRRLFVSNLDDGEVAVVDADSREVVETISVLTPNGIGVLTARGKAYVASQADDEVEVVDLGSLTVSDTLTGFVEPFAIEVDEALGRVFVVNDAPTGNGSVTILDANSDTVTDTVPVGKNPGAAVYDEVTGRLFVLNAADSTVSVVDVGAASVTDTISVPLGPVSAVIDTATGRLLVACQVAGEIAIIDSGAVTDTISEPNFPAALAIHDRTLVVSRQNHDDVGFFDLDTLELLGTAPAGDNPKGLAVLPVN